MVGTWAEDKESEFRAHTEKYRHERRLAQERDPVGFEIEESWRALSPFKPGKGGVPRVPEWLPYPPTADELAEILDAFDVTATYDKPNHTLTLSATLKANRPPQGRSGQSRSSGGPLWTH
jgi:hypothetical protein